MRARTIGIGAIAIALAGCGGVSARRSNQQDDGSPPDDREAGAAASFSQCHIEDGGLDLWLAAPPGAFIDVDDEVCFAVPFEGATPETAEWLLAFGIVEADGGDAALLATEPDGARRWAEDELELEGITPLGEGSTTILGSPARWYGLRGRADELGMRDVIVARVRRGNIWIIAVAVTRPGDQARLDTLLGMIPLARTH